MIPLRDINRSSTTPVVMYALVAACVAAFLYTVGLPSDASRAAFFQEYGAIPRVVTRGPWPGAWIGLLTSMFLHGSWLHLGGNMLYLWIFGDNVEDAMGHLGFLVFYLLTGVIAALTHIVTQPGSPVPLIGASGAIAGVLGGYLVLYPRARVLSAVLIWFFIRLVELPAALVLLVWFLLQVVEGVMSLGAAPGAATVAFFAHVGGFLSGALLVRVFARR